MMALPGNGYGPRKEKVQSEFRNNHNYSTCINPLKVTSIDMLKKREVFEWAFVLAIMGVSG